MLIQRSISIPFERVGLSAPACQLDLGTRRSAIRVHGCGWRVPVRSRRARRSKLAYGVPGSGKGSRCELMLTRDRRTEPFETSLAFKTVEGSPLPARMLNVLFDADDWLGAEAKVSGTLHLRQAGSTDWKASFQGELLDVDLARLVNRAVPSPSADRKGPHRVRESGVGPATLGPGAWLGSRSRASSPLARVRSGSTCSTPWRER